MAFAAALLPYLAYAGAAATVVSAAQKSQADKNNAGVMANEQKLSIEQASAQEAMVRRNSREQLGRQAAAFGGAGVGYGGSSETAMGESAINQELDALNTRYKGALVGYGYGVQSSLLKQQSKDDMTAGLLLAGGQAMNQTKYSFLSGLKSPEAPSGLGGRTTG